jgi:hypothetical protein
VLPLTAQAVDVVENVTGSPESEVALTVKVCPGVGAGNVIVWVARLTVKLAVAEAALYVLLPLCVAVRVQVPAVNRDTVEPLTVQTGCVDEEYVTGNPLVAVAVRASLVSAACDAGCGNVTVCESTPIEKDKLTGVAAEYVLLPACVAWIVQSPFVKAVVREQMSGVDEANATGKPLVEVAVTEKGFPIWMPVGAGPNVMVWEMVAMVKLCVTAWDAWSWHEPGVNAVVTEQKLGVRETNETGNPEEAVALRV